MRTALTPARLRSLLVYLGIVAVVFASALAASFVFAHEPQRETVSISVRDTLREPPATRVRSGVIAAVADGSLVLAGDDEASEIEIPSGVAIDELVYVGADGAPFEPGAVVNLGTADTQAGFIVTGIVAVEQAAP